MYKMKKCEVKKRTITILLYYIIGTYNIYERIELRKKSLVKSDDVQTPLKSEYSK